MSVSGSAGLRRIGSGARARLRGVAQRLGLDKLRHTAVGETLLLLAVLVAADRILLAGDVYWHFAPHPFWLIVILISTQYGSREGLIAAALCSAALFTPGIPAQRLTQDLYSYLLELAYRPLLWSTAAALLGELRGRQVRERAQLRADLDATRERARTIAAAYESLQERTNRLEVRIAGQLRTVVSMYRAARAVETMEPGQVLVGAIENVRAVISPQKCSIFLLTDDRLEAGIQRGWERRERIKRVFEPDSALYREIVVNRRALTVSNPDDAEALDGQGVLAAPLINTETGAVRGMIKIEDMGFPEFSQSTIEIFKVMCEWVGAFYTNALRYRKATLEQAVDSTTELYASHFYPRLETVLSAIAERAGIALTTLTLSLPDARERSADDRALLATTLGGLVKARLRDTDVAFDRTEGEFRFVLLLTVTEPAGARIVGERLVQAFRAELPEGLRDLPTQIDVSEVVAIDQQAEPHSP